MMYIIQAHNCMYIHRCKTIDVHNETFTSSPLLCGESIISMYCLRQESNKVSYKRRFAACDSSCVNHRKLRLWAFTRQETNSIPATSCYSPNESYGFIFGSTDGRPLRHNTCTIGPGIGWILFSGSESIGFTNWACVENVCNRIYWITIIYFSRKINEKSIIFN